MGDNDRRTLALMPDDDILSYLRGVSSRRPLHATRKLIQRHLNSNNSVEQNNEAGINTTKWSKRDVKDALKRLVKRGDIVKDGKEYSCSIPDTVDEVDVPIAQRMKRQQLQQSGSSDKDKVDNGEFNKIDLDEEIRRLEEELAEESDGDDDDDDFDDVDESDNEIDDNDSGMKEWKSNEILDDNYSNGIIRLSNLADDRIEPLPSSALPQSKRRHLKGVDAAAASAHHDEEAHSAAHRKKRKHSQNEKEEHIVSEGLKHAVHDLLQNYIRPSQLDRPPFYCRVCQHQAKSQSEFDLHRTSEFHKVAVKEEQKKTYCKLCRKQLTSVIQMEEHLTSKPHRDRMDFVKGKQQGWIGNSEGGGVGDGGRIGTASVENAARNQRGFAKRDGSGRQWC